MLKKCSSQQALKIISVYMTVRFCCTVQVKLELYLLGSIIVTAGSLGYLEMYMQGRISQNPHTGTFLNIYGSKQIILQISMAVAFHRA